MLISRLCRAEKTQRSRHPRQFPDHEERLLGQRVAPPRDDGAAARDGRRERHVLAGAAGELLGQEERLRQEALQPPRQLDHQPVLDGEFLDPENRDQIQQLPVARQISPGAVLSGVVLTRSSEMCLDKPSPRPEHASIMVGNAIGEGAWVAEGNSYAQRTWSGVSRDDDAGRPVAIKPNFDQARHSKVRGLFLDVRQTMGKG